jgi:hypothetical protein
MNEKSMTIYFSDYSTEDIMIQAKNTQLLTDNLYIKIANHSQLIINDMWLPRIPNGWFGYFIP